MAILRFVTHPEVLVDSTVPVPRWGLNEKGRARAMGMLAQPWISNPGAAGVAGVNRVNRVVSSGETKAIETAAILADHLGIGFEIVEALHENDRSATGFVPPDHFEVLANAFFANPNESVQGWETATNAQTRVMSVLVPLIDELRTATPDVGDTLVVGHGGVGTLAYCALAGRPIDRQFDQPGQGHYWSYDAAASSMLHHWLRIDDTPCAMKGQP